MSRSVLICDDAKFMRSVIGQMLLDNGFEVAGEAATGQEAIDSLAKLEPDLITMDIVMPEMNGIDAVRAIVERHPAARIVVCSAVGQEPMVEEAMSAGAKSFVVKPFTASELLEAVERALA